MFLGIEKHDSDRIAIKDAEGVELTYGQLCFEVEDVQSALPRRSLVFCLCRNVVGCALGYLALVEAGAVPVMLNAFLPFELLRQLDDVYCPEYYWRPADLEAAFTGDVLHEAFGYQLLSVREERCELDARLELCMSTSGSTGDPKLVRYKKGNLEANARNVAAVFSWGADERGFVDLGLQYTMGLNVFNSLLYAGGTALLCDCNILSADYWDYLKDERATSITGVPFSYDVFARLGFFRMELPHLRTIAEGGGRLTESRFREVAEYAAANGKRFFATFGTTETAARISYLPPELALGKTCSIGRAIPEGELFLIDSEGTVVEGSPGEGELCYRGPNVTMGYARCRDDLAKGDEFCGEYHTGDLARRDEDGMYYITGRLSRFVKLLGHRVSLDQCERLLADELSGACACVGIDDKLTVYLEVESDAQKARDVLCGLLGLRKSLFEIKTMARLPRNDVGKVLYAQLGGVQ